MKLLELLVKELPKRGGWPQNALSITQDNDGSLCAWDTNDPHYEGFSWKHHTGNSLAHFWYGEEWATPLSSDHNESIVTYWQYKAALAASDDWTEWHGGECPVDSDAIVEVKFRWHNQHQYNNDRAGDFYWAHTGRSSDIIAYRLQQPTKSEQVRAGAWRSYAGITENDEEADLNECIGQDIDIPEWNGEGLPPVGIICQAKVPRSITGWEWRKVKVVESGIPGAEKEVLVYDLETTLPAWTDEFRPLRTEAEKAREKLAASLHVAACASPIESNRIGPLYFKLADAIISGSVFGTTFKAGK